VTGCDRLAPVSTLRPASPGSAFSTSAFQHAACGGFQLFAFAELLTG
jgi:hypothetical protein